MVLETEIDVVNVFHYSDSQQSFRASNVEQATRASQSIDYKVTIARYELLDVELLVI